MSSQAIQLRDAAVRAFDRPQEYSRPDIVILRSIAEASDKIRDELKHIGDERRYITALRVMRTQSKLVENLTCELIRRFEEVGCPDDNHC